MTAAVPRVSAPAGIGKLGGTAACATWSTPTLLDLGSTGSSSRLLNGKFCGTGANYDLIKAELAQFRLSHNTVNPNAQANRVVGVVDPRRRARAALPVLRGHGGRQLAGGLGAARPGKTGQLLGLESLTRSGSPRRPREPVRRAHSQNTPPRTLRSTGASTSSSAPSSQRPQPDEAVRDEPRADNVNTLLKVPDYAFLFCVFGGPPNTECTDPGPGTVNATAPVAATLSFVMSGTTTGETRASPAPRAPERRGDEHRRVLLRLHVPQTSEPDSAYGSSSGRARERGPVEPGRAVGFRHSSTARAAGATEHSSGLFSFALPFETNANRIELWKGAPGCGSVPSMRGTGPPPVVASNMTVGGSASLELGQPSWA